MVCAGPEVWRERIETTGWRIEGGTYASNPVVNPSGNNGSLNNGDSLTPLDVAAMWERVGKK